MESKKNKIRVPGYCLLLVTGLLVLGGPWANVAHGRSLYTIGEITNSFNPLPILTYDIGPDGTLTFQTQQTVPFRDGGAVGIAIDWQSGYLFVTYEFSGFLQVLDARTMADVGKVSAVRAENLAGIAYDESKGLLYCVDRGTDKLYCYRWYPDTGKLTPQPGSPFTLAGSSAYGIALDEEGERLYTANATRSVPVYDTSDWSLIETITVARPAISIAVDVSNDLLYTGAGYLTDFTLNQYDLATGQTRSVQVDPAAGVIGLAVDSSTGCVYVTTGLSNRPGGDDLLAYDTSLTLIDAVLDIGNPTGIVIPARELGYNPLQFAKTIVTDDDIESGQAIYVGLGDTVTYQLCFDNTVTVSDVSIVDTLPEHVTFISADGNGDLGHYNANEHTYSWSLASVSAGSHTCLELRVKVKPQVPVGTLLRNHATIRTRTIPPTTVSADALVRGGSLQPLALTKQVIGGVQKEDGLAYANAGDVVSYAIHYSNEGNDYPVTKVSIVDTLPEAMTFVGADADVDGGSYDPVQHTYTWATASLPSGETGNITVRAQVGQDIAAGTLLTNVATIDCNETAPTTATVDVTVRHTELQPLNLIKQIANGGTDPNGDGQLYVNPGESITYLLCFDNRDNEQTVETISIIDFLPPEMTFISATTDGESGYYDPSSHTYVWSIASLASGQTSCVELVAQVKEDTPAGTVILNRATIDSDQTEATTADNSLIVNPIDYRPLNLTKKITAGALPGPDETVSYVGIGDEVTYQICFDNNANDHRVQGLSLVDVLPPEVAFVSAEGDGTFGSYDAAKHAYTWSYPSLMPGAGVCFDLVVQVRADTLPGTAITNYVTLDSTDTAGQSASIRAVAQETQLKPLVLTKTVTNGIAGQDEVGTKYVSLGQEVTYTLCVTNNNGQALDSVLIVDTLPNEVSFVSADGDGEFGRYDPEAHTYMWSYSTLQPGAQVCLDLTVRVNEDAGGGTTITNRASVETNNTPSVETDTDVTTELEPPVLRKTILDAESDGIRVGEFWSACPGQQITYQICIENNQDATLHDVVVVDTLPAGVAYIRTDDASGHYDPMSHTYMWTYPTLASGTVQCLKLTVQLGYHLQSDAILRNTVALETSETPPTDTDVDVIIGEAPMKAALTLSPLILGREGYNRSDQITAVLELPAEVQPSDISDEPLRIDPGHIAANTQTVSVENGKVQICASFDLFKVLDTIEADGITTLYVGGRFQSGRTFVGEAVVLAVAVRPF